MSEPNDQESTFDASEPNNDYLLREYLGDLLTTDASDTPDNMYFAENPYDNWDNDWD